MDGIYYIKNPLTGRKIQMGGKAYKKLVRDGIIESDASLLYNIPNDKIDDDEYLDMVREKLNSVVPEGKRVYRTKKNGFTAKRTKKRQTIEDIVRQTIYEIQGKQNIEEDNNEEEDNEYDELSKYLENLNLDDEEYNQEDGEEDGEEDAEEYQTDFTEQSQTEYTQDENNTESSESEYYEEQ